MLAEATGIQAIPAAFGGSASSSTFGANGRHEVYDQNRRIRRLNLIRKRGIVPIGGKAALS